MAEYDMAFAAKLAKVAEELDEKEPYRYDARRVVVYLSRVSVEISMKALLERAGKSVKEIRARSHDLRGLLADLSECEVNVELKPNVFIWQSASCVRDVYIDLGLVNIPIGVLIDAEDIGTSAYPNQIRYGETVIDIDPWLLASTAILLADWAIKHQDAIRVKQT
jgi:HEPN domain-containing protein